MAADIPDEADALVLEWCLPGKVHEYACFAWELFGSGYRHALVDEGLLDIVEGDYVTTPEGIEALNRRYEARGRG